MISTRNQYTIVQLTVMDQTGDSYYRMRWPAAELASQAPNFRVINLDARAKERHRSALEADLLILYQAADPDLLPIMHKRRALGRRTLVEYNDNFYEPPASSPVAKEWASPLLWQSYERIMDASDGILVTGPGLERLFRARFPEKQITILENHFPRALIPFDMLLNQKTKTPSIGWAGSLGHMSDLLAVAPVLSQLLNEFPDLKLHVMGNDAIPGLLHIPVERFEFQKWGSVFEYFEFWKAVQIGCAPLLDTPYNRCRSDVKAIEMAAHGVAPLIKSILPYEKFISKTKCETYNSNVELTSKLRALIGDSSRREAEARRSYEYVQSERLGTNNSERLALYEHLLPATPNDFQWQLTLGYHEVNGEPSPQSFVARSMMDAEQKRSSGDEAGTIRLLKAIIAENPDAPEPAIALIKMIARTSAETARVEVERCEKLFPHDLRFTFLKMSLVAGAERREVFSNILQQLRAGGDKFSHFFRKQTVEICTRALQDDPTMTSRAIEALQLFPEALALHFKVAETLERFGKYDEAASHFSIVEGALDSAALNNDFLRGVDATYIKTWREALEARGKS